MPHGEYTLVPSNHDQPFLCDNCPRCTYLGIGFETRTVHAGSDPAANDGAAVIPIVRSTVFTPTPGATYHDIRYPRLSTLRGQKAVGQAVAELEGAEAGLVTASGMAAISSTLLAVLKDGGHVLAQRSLYGGTQSLLHSDLPHFGMEATSFDASGDPAEWEQALRPATRAIYVESLTNPLLEVADHEKVLAFARRHDLVTMIDNTFTPIEFRPLAFGYDLVLHSATKYLNGHSDVVAGAIAGSEERVRPIKRMVDHLGGSIDPHAAYLLHRGLKTLGLRKPRQNQTAHALAERLRAHREVVRVAFPGLESDPQHDRAKRFYDGFGAIITFEVAGGAAAAERFTDALELILHSVSLGGVESNLTIPAQTSHVGMEPEDRARLGITDGLVRLSVGIEHADDLVRDLENALTGCRRWTDFSRGENQASTETLACPGLEKHLETPDSLPKPLGLEWITHAPCKLVQ